MTLDKKQLKEKLEAERDVLFEEMKDIGVFNPETKTWEATPEPQPFPEADQNDAADRFEDFEERTSLLRDLEKRLKSILNAIKNFGSSGFGKCKVCKKEIEAARMKANPAARTCMKHLND